MTSEKVFNGTVAYLKMVTGFGAVMCFASMFFLGFDPGHALDGMIWNDLYGTADLPVEAKPAFTLAFLLFSCLSVLSMLLLFMIAKFSLARKEKWAYWCFILIGFFWPLGGTIITCYTEAWSYFISVGMMTLLFFPPIVLLFPHFKETKNI